MEIGEIPHLADFTYHKTLVDVDFDGVPVAGLDADFYRRPVGDRLLSVGVYRFGGAETHRAWGWVGEAHCSWHAYRDPGTGGFDGPFAGCPLLRVLREGDRARGFELGSGSPARRYLVDPDHVVAGAVTARPVGPVPAGSGSVAFRDPGLRLGALQTGGPSRVDDRRGRDREPEEQAAAGEQGRGPR